MHPNAAAAAQPDATQQGPAPMVTDGTPAAQGAGLTHKAHGNRGRAAGGRDAGPGWTVAAAPARVDASAGAIRSDDYGS